MALLRSVKHYNSVLVSRNLPAAILSNARCYDGLLTTSTWSKRVSTVGVRYYNNHNGTRDGTARASSFRSVSTAVPVQNSSATVSQRDPLDTSFDNPIDAFKSKTTAELIRGYVVYLMCSSETLVENNMKVILC